LRLVFAIGALTAILLAACGGGGSKATDVSVTLKEWSVTPSIDDITEGKVKIKVTNEGTIPHEFVIVKSDLSPEGLPVENGNVTEAQVNIIDEIEPFAAGTTQSLELNLTPGKYLLICNITEQVPGQKVTSHYQNGMVAFFQVEPK
jgi:uncharacterized cupredoxin-like copper-binding protein